MTDPSTESTTPAPDSFAAKLKAAREAAGLSKQEALKITRIFAPTYHAYEAGRKAPEQDKQDEILGKLKEAQTSVTVPPLPADLQDSEQPGETVETSPEPELTQDKEQPKLRVAGFPVNFKGTAADLAQGIAERLEVGEPEPNPEAEAFERAAIEKANVERSALLTPTPDIPVGNVYTTPEGVLLRRLADDDQRDGAETIDGRRWFTVGFVPPHPRAKQRTALKPEVPAKLEAPQEVGVAPESESGAVGAISVSPEAQIAPEGPGLGKRGWAFWNGS